MAMNFWEAQRKRKSRTSLFLIFFIVMTFGIALLIEYVVRILAKEGYTPPMPYLGAIFLGITFIAALFYYAMYKGQGGSFVAESLGGINITKNPRSFKEEQLLNIVQEMAIASGVPMPQVYVIDSKEINAFAAGMKPENAAITVTTGALQLLDRDELQGVVAHEFSHINHGDMKISMRLSAMIMGFFILIYLGIRLLEGSLFFGGRDDKKGSPVALAALILVLAGAITWLAGAILRSMVSREREYLADASAVQYTRNPHGIANALKKIAKYSQVNDMPRRGGAYAHLYFENHSFWSGLFATHPPIEKRIEAIEGRKYIEEEWLEDKPKQ